MKPHGTQLSLFETRNSADLSGAAAREAFAVRVSLRARRLTARVHVGGRVEIVVPVGVGPKAVREFVHRFTPWIDRKVESMKSLAQPAAAVPEWIDFAFTGERFKVRWERQERRGITLRGDELEVSAPDETAARSQLQCWLKRAAAERLTPRLLELAHDLDLSIARVAIRCQRTRWGSCSTRGTVSLNCSLVFLGRDVVRYLFIHELAHTKHMNHSAEFWKLVGHLEPEYRRLDRELLAGWRTVPTWVFKT